MVRSREPTVRQVQGQKVNIASAEHGMTDEVCCAYVDYALGGMPSWQQQQAMERNSVKILFFKGRVKRVFCHHLSSQHGCKSKRNPEKDRTCFMLDLD